MDPKIIIISGLLISASLTTFLSLYAFRRLGTVGSKAYIGLLATVTIYCLGYAIELFHTDLSGILFSLRIEYLGMPFIPVFWVLLAMQYTGQSPRIPPWFYGVIFVVPVITVMLHFTNAHHHMFYKAMAINHDSPFPVALITKGPWYYVNVAFNNICMIAGNVLFFRMMRRSVGAHRQQAATVFAVSLIPWIGNIIYQAGLSPYGIDLVPFTLAAASPFFAFALFRFRMLDVVPIACGTVFDVMHDPVVLLDKLNRLADFNPAAEGIFRDLDAEGIGIRISDVLIHDPDLALDLEMNDQLEKEIQVQSGGNDYNFNIQIIPIETRKKMLVGKLAIFHDVTQQRELMNRLKELAIRDGLTGLYNRRHLLELSHDEVLRAKRYGHSISLILIDLDQFKQINDTYGHLVGDEVLRSAAERLGKGLRSFDIFGRYGGEEFVVVLPETSPDKGCTMAERLRSLLEDHDITHSGYVISVTASFGVSGFENDQPDVNLDTLLQLADEALYQAKDQGRNTVIGLPCKLKKPS